MAATGEDAVPVAEATETFTIGAPARCEDGKCGALSRIVVDPLSRTVTHLVVEPRHRHALSRLVPIAMAHAVGDEVHLRCTLAIFRALRYAQETEFLPEGDPWVASPSAGPASSYAGAALGLPMTGMMLWPYYEPAGTLVTQERVPLGEVEVRRREHVYATDGAIGRVQGLVVDGQAREVTHILLQQGHLWGARNLAIPIGAVAALDADGVRLSLSKDAVSALPEIELKDPGQPEPDEAPGDAATP